MGRFLSICFRKYVHGIKLQYQIYVRTKRTIFWTLLCAPHFDVFSPLHSSLADGLWRLKQTAVCINQARRKYQTVTQSFSFEWNMIKPNRNIFWTLQCGPHWCCRPVSFFFGRWTVKAEVNNGMNQSGRDRNTKQYELIIQMIYWTGQYKQWIDRTWQLDIR